MSFELFRKGLKFTIYTLSKVDEEIEKIKDDKAKKRITGYLKKPADRIPNQKEQWERIKVCKDFKAYELKPKPYRLGCYVFEESILVVHLWRVQKKKSIKKSAEIRKVCGIIKEVDDGFKGFVRRI